MSEREFLEIMQLIESVGLDKTLELILQFDFQFENFCGTFSFGNSSNPSAIYANAFADIRVMNKTLFEKYYSKMDAKGVTNGIISCGATDMYNMKALLAVTNEINKWKVWLDKVEEFVCGTNATIPLWKIKHSQSTHDYILFKESLPSSFSEKGIIEQLTKRFPNKFSTSTTTTVDTRFVHGIFFQ